MGITAKFDSTISIVSEWMAMGNAHDYAQDPAIDPRPLVSWKEPSPIYLSDSIFTIQITDIACGMDYLHTYTPGPIIHGDLKGMGMLNTKFLVPPKQFIHSPMCLFPTRDVRSSRTWVICRSLINLSSNTASYRGYHTPSGMLPEDVDNITSGSEYVMTKERDIWAYGMTCPVSMICSLYFYESI